MNAFLVKKVAFFLYMEIFEVVRVSTGCYRLCLESPMVAQKKKCSHLLKWHAQRFHIGIFLANPGKRAKLQELKLSLAE